MSWQDVQSYSSLIITLKATSTTDANLTLRWGVGVTDTALSDSFAIYTDAQHIVLLAGQSLTYEFQIRTRWLNISIPDTCRAAITYNSTPTAIRFVDSSGHIANVYQGDASSGLYTMLTDGCGRHIGTNSDTCASAIYTTLCDSSAMPLYIKNSRLGLALLDSSANALGTKSGALDVVCSDICGHTQAFKPIYNDISVTAGTGAGYYALADNCGKPVDTLVNTTSAAKNALYVTLTDAAGRLISVNNPLPVYSLFESVISYTIDTSVGDAMVSLVNVNDKVNGTCFNLSTLSIYNSYDTTVWVKVHDIYDTLGKVGQIFGRDRFDLIDDTLMLNIAVPAGATRDIHLENGLLFYHGCMARASTQSSYTAGTSGNLNCNAVYIHGSYSQVSGLDGQATRPAPHSHTSAGDTIVQGHPADTGFSGWFCNAVDTSMIVGAISCFSDMGIYEMQDICASILTVWDVSIGAVSALNQYVKPPKIPTQLYVASSGGSVNLNVRPYKIYKVLLSFSTGGITETSLCFGMVTPYNNAENQLLARFILDSSMYSIDLWNQEKGAYAGIYLQNNAYTSTLVTQVDHYRSKDIAASGPVTIRPSQTVLPYGLLAISLSDPITTRTSQRTVFINPNCTIADICLSALTPYADNCLSLSNHSYSIDNSSYFSICAAAISNVDTYGRMTVKANDKVFCYSTPDFRGSIVYVNDTSMYNSYIYKYTDLSVSTSYLDLCANDKYIDDSGAGYYDPSYDISYVRFYTNSGAMYDSTARLDISGYPQPYFMLMDTYSGSWSLLHLDISLRALSCASDGNNIFGATYDNSLCDISSGSLAVRKLFELPNNSDISLTRSSDDGQHILSIKTGWAQTYLNGANADVGSGSPIDVAVSSTGQYMMVAVLGRRDVYFSTDFGVNFHKTDEVNDVITNDANWLVPMSSDGSFMVGISTSYVGGTLPGGYKAGFLRWSRNSGANWVTSIPDVNLLFSNALCAGNGSKLLLFTSAGYMYTVYTAALTAGTNYSYTSTNIGIPNIISAAASSNLNIIAVSDYNTVYVNYSGGKGRWTSYPISSLASLAMSANGRKIFAVKAGGFLFAFT